MEFNDWEELYKKDPKLFEVKRREYIRVMITNMCVGDDERRRKLQQHQWQIEKELRKYKGVARYNKMVELLWEKVSQLQKVLEKI